MFYTENATIKPGMLVSLKTTVSGNVQYRRQTLVAEHVTENGELRGEWQTAKHVQDAAEHDRAKKARADARNAIAAACSHSSFGLLCTQENADNLDAAIAKAQTIVAEFNESAKLSHISVYVITGKIAADDAKAIEAINYEMLELLMEMADGVESADVKKARDACNAARNLSEMLVEAKAKALQVAIDATREACRAIVKGSLPKASKDATMATLQHAMESFANLPKGE